jgi:hypothetical protein
VATVETITLIGQRSTWGDPPPVLPSGMPRHCYLLDLWAVADVEVPFQP